MKLHFKPLNKFVLLFCLTLFLNFSANALPNTLNLNNTNWQDVLHIAKEQNKAIFVEIYSSNCNTCNAFEKQIDQNIAVTNYLNKYFIQFKIDINTTYGAYFAEINKINDLPGCLFFNTSGSLINKIEGESNLSLLITNAQKSINDNNYININLPNYVSNNSNSFNNSSTANNEISKEKEIEPNKNFTNYIVNEEEINEKQAPTYFDNAIEENKQNMLFDNNLTINDMNLYFENGNRNTDFLKDYAYALKSSGFNTTEPINEYIKAKNKLWKKIDTETIEFIYNFSDNIESNALEALIKNKTVFSKKFGKEHIKTKIQQICIDATDLAISENKANLFYKIEKLIKKSQFEDYETFLLALKLKFYKNTGNNSDYSNAIVQFIALHEVNDPVFLNQMSWNIICVPKQSIKNYKQALNWCNLSIKLDSNFYNLRTKAFALYKLNKTSEARACVNEYINMCQNLGIDYSDIYTLLEKINKNEVHFKPYLL